MHNLLEHITDREVDDEVGGAVDDDEEVADADQNRDPDGALAAATGVKKRYFWVEEIFR
jgi:hypothetical protein